MIVGFLAVAVGAIALALAVAWWEDGPQRRYTFTVLSLRAAGVGPVRARWAAVLNAVRGYR